VTQKITDGLNPLAESALCAWFGTESIQRAVPWVIGATGLIPTPATKAASLALTALQLGCNFKPDLSPDYVQGGCWKRGDPTFVEYYNPPFGQIEGKWVGPLQDFDNTAPMTRVLEILSIEGYVDKTNPNSGITQRHLQAKFRFFDDTEQVVTMKQGYDPTDEQVAYLRLFDNGSECLKPAPDSTDPPALEPITQYSAELNCNVTAVLNGFELQADGTATPVITFQSESTGPQTRDGADPPDVSGCNWFGDLVYVFPTNQKDPYVYPLPPDPPQVPVPPSDGDCPDPCPDIQPEMVGESTYVMVAPCDKDAQGDNLEWEKTLPAEQGLPAIAARLEALSEQMSQHLAWKTPICNEQPEIEGDWRTISFRSESTSPYGNSRLRKRFRYRSTSGLGLGEIVDYWKDFSFQSGSVVVGHVGSSWGSPQVWAATADEGKRVIRHAAGEAGIDPDQVGRWAIGSSSSSRFGVSDTMKVDTTGGYYWITSRDGSDNRPVVALTSDL